MNTILTARCEVRVGLKVRRTLGRYWVYLHERNTQYSTGTVAVLGER